MSFRRLYAHARDEPGQAVVEMALVLPILMLIILGIFKFGILYNNYLQLTDAARTGARRLAVDRGQGTTNTPCDDATSELANSASSLGGTINITITEDNDGNTYTNTAIGGTSGTTATVCPTLVSGSAAHVEAKYPCDLNILGITIVAELHARRQSERTGRMTSRLAQGLRRRRPSVGSDSGQSLIFVVVMMVILLAFGGLVLDVGKIYIAQRQLQTATDAAALAAAQDLPDDTTAQTTACQFSGSDGTAAADPCTGIAGANVASLTGVQTTARARVPLDREHRDRLHRQSLVPAGQALNPSGTLAGGCNAIKVTESVSVTPWILGILHVEPQTVTATATASMAGGTPEPLDVEMINDTTASMQTRDTCGGTPTDVPASASLTQEDCAKAGIRALLTNLDPCTPSLTTCDPQSAVVGQIPSPNRLDEVGMVTFPGLKSSFIDGQRHRRPTSSTAPTSARRRATRPTRPARRTSRSSRSRATTATPTRRRRPARDALPGLEPRALGLLDGRRLPERRLPGVRPVELRRRRSPPAATRAPRTPARRSPAAPGPRGRTRAPSTPPSPRETPRARLTRAASP